MQKLMIQIIEENEHMGLEKNYLKTLCSNFFQSFVQGNLQLLEKKLWRQLFLLLIILLTSIIDLFLTVGFGETAMKIPVTG